MPAVALELQTLTRRLTIAGLLLCAASASAPSAVVRVGATSLDRPAVERWLTQLVPARWSTDERGRPQVAATVHQVLVPELLLTEHATAEVEGDPAFESRRDEAIAIAFERLLEQTIEVSEDEIRDFHARYADRYQQPRAILVWRILTKDEATARRIVHAVQDQRLGVYEWGNLAREHSLDDATKHRDGSLGFVRSDGTTDVPQVRVAPEIFAAADRVADGQLVAEPVREGEGFAVIWRRGTRPAKQLSLEDERADITAIITRHRLQEAQREFIESLRDAHLTEYRPELLEAIRYELPNTVGAEPSGSAVTSSTAGAPSSSSAGEPPAAGGSPAPIPGDRGER